MYGKNGDEAAEKRLFFGPSMPNDFGNENRFTRVKVLIHSKMNSKSKPEIWEMAEMAGNSAMDTVKPL